MAEGSIVRDDNARLWLTATWILVTVLVLLAPLVAMQMNVDGVSWTVEDFLFAGAVLVGAGVAYELATWRVTTLSKRLLIAGVIGLVVTMIWVEAAVGVFH
jgi:uncharacterized membrane protein